MVREQLIIFTRYPEAGKTKTRLIPLLGETGAAILQRQMTEDTVSKARNLWQTRSLSLVTYYAGGTQQLMGEWLGADLNYKLQNDGDLGRRMFVAFEQGFMAGMNRLVIIGIDCPELDERLLVQAFETLSEHDLVLGPATDGGYYLIGMSRLLPEIFTGIAWGTSTVLAQTRQIAQNLRLRVAYLPVLTDVDRPEDFPVWQRYLVNSV